MVYLHSPRVFQSLMVLSRDPETIWRLSAEKATERTSLSCPTKRRVVRPGRGFGLLSSCCLPKLWRMYIK